MEKARFGMGLYLQFKNRKKQSKKKLNKTKGYKQEDKWHIIINQGRWLWTFTLLLQIKLKTKQNWDLKKNKHRIKEKKYK